MESPVRFIIIDDDPVNNMLCSIVIDEAAGESKIKTFEVPEKGFEYITKEYLKTDHPTVLFLDINMPTWSGWEFLENFEKLDVRIKKQFKIYILSSSIDPGDRQRALENNNVADYIEKPLSENIVLAILMEQEVVI